MLHLRKDTLAGLKQSALFIPRDVSMHAGPVVAARVNKYMSEVGGLAKPEAEALKFYFANHAFSLIAAKFDEHEPMPEAEAAIARGYIKYSSDLIVRLAYYCLLIIVREARHMHQNTALINDIKAKHGPLVGAFIDQNRHHGEKGAVGAFRNHCPDVPIGNLVAGIAEAFFKGGWSSGYGGPKWGVIADQVYKLVKGIITPEMFGDTAFTLAHNGGPIFNKGMLYTGYDHAFIFKMLDVQRSGQIPQLLAEGVPTKLPSDFISYVEQARSVVPGLDGYVDWFKVEALGALRKYPAEKKLQVAKYGASAEAGVKYYTIGDDEPSVKIVQRKAA